MIILWWNMTLSFHKVEIGTLYDLWIINIDCKCPQNVVQLVRTTPNEAEVINFNLPPSSCANMSKKKKKFVSTLIIIWNFHWYNEIYNLGTNASPSMRVSRALSQILGLSEKRSQSPICGPHNTIKRGEKYLTMNVWHWEMVALFYCS